MYQVKKLAPETEIDRITLGEAKTIVYRSPRSVSYAVVNDAGKVVKSTNGQYETYPRKSTAQQVADWYNHHA